MLADRMNLTRIIRFWVALNAKQELRRDQNRLERDADSLFERISFSLGQSHQAHQSVDLVFSRRTPESSAGQVGCDQAGALGAVITIGVPADENPLVTLGQRGYHWIEWSTDFRVVNRKIAVAAGDRILFGFEVVVDKRRNDFVVTGFNGYPDFESPGLVARGIDIEQLDLNSIEREGELHERRSIRPYAA